MSRGMAFHLHNQPLPGMMDSLTKVEELEARLAQTEARLAAAEANLSASEETLRAIREGEVDALLVGDKVYTLQGADHPYRVLVEQMQEGTITVDPNGLVLYSNGQFASLVKMPVEKVIGTDVSTFLPAGEQKMFAALLEAGALGYSRGELTMLASDQSTVPVQISLNPLESDGMQNVCAVITDLTERRRSEAIIREEQLSRSILDHAAEAIVVIDAEGKVLRANESAQQLAGRNPLLQHFDAAFPLQSSDQSGSAPAVSEFRSRRLLDLMGAGNVLRGAEVSLGTKGRESRSLLLGAGPLWSETWELIGCVVTLTDITERSRSEAALARQAEKLAQSNNDLQQFAYSASHDLQEPLRHLVIYSQLLQQRYASKLDAAADELIGHAVHSAKRMEGLLKDLLAYAHAGDAPDVLEARVDANRILEEALATLQASIEENQAIVTHDFLPELQVHGVHLQQLFQNLIGNALKYRSAAPPRIHISARLKSASTWLLCVEDNGIGVEPRYHSQVFGLFKRLHNSKAYAGNGIGLTICQKIVERYEGHIWVESDSGKGSRFCFTLPGTVGAHAAD